MIIALTTDDFALALICWGLILVLILWCFYTFVGRSDDDE